MFIWCTIKVQQVNISKDSLGNYISIHLSIVFSKLGRYSMGLKFSNEKFSIYNHEFVCLMILNLIYILLMWKLYVKLKRNTVTHCIYGLLALSHQFEYVGIFLDHRRTSIETRKQLSRNERLFFYWDISCNTCIFNGNDKNRVHSEGLKLVLEDLFPIDENTKKKLTNLLQCNH